MKRNCIFSLLILLAMSVHSSTASAVQDEKEIRDVIAKLNEAMKNSDLEAAAKWMTKSSIDEHCTDTILMCIQFASEDFVDADIRDHLNEIIDEHGLDEIEIPESLTNLESEEFPTDEEMDALRKDVLKVVPLEKRFDVINEIREAARGFMMNESAFAGEIQKIDIKDDKASVSVELDIMDELQDAAEGEFDFEIPPMILSFKKIDNNWKWDGLGSVEGEVDLMEDFEVEDNIKGSAPPEDKMDPDRKKVPAGGK